MVSIALIILPPRMFSLCGTILNEREGEEMRDPVSSQEPMHWTLPNFALEIGVLMMSKQQI